MTSCNFIKQYVIDQRVRSILSNWGMIFSESVEIN